MLLCFGQPIEKNKQQEAIRNNTNALRYWLQQCNTSIVVQ